MITAKSIIDALGGRNGKARCPAHDDRNPSLSVSQGSDGKVLLKCFAGCTQAAVIDALRQRNLWPTMQRPETKMNSRAEPDPKYHDDSASEYYQQCERKHRAFVLFRVGKHAADTLAETYLRYRGITIPVPPNLYFYDIRNYDKYGHNFGNHPAMVAPIWSPLNGKFQGAHVTFIRGSGRGKAKGKNSKITLGVIKGGVVQFVPEDADDNPKGPLLIAEGIEDALSVLEITGCESWSALSATNMDAITVPARYREVIICANNDVVGLDAANRFAERLAKEGRVVRVAVPEPEGSDWNDMLCDEDVDIDELESDILEAPKVDAPEDTGLHVVTADQLRTLDLPPRENLLSPWLPQQGLAMIHAKRGVGKTYIALGIAYAVTHGQPFLRWSVDTPGEVLYVDGEMPASLLQQRIKAFDAYFEGEPVYPLRIVTPDLQDGSMPDLSTREGQAAVDHLVSDETGLIIIDSISTLCRSGEENLAEDWLPVQNWLLKHRAAGRSVLLIHHSGKGGLQRGTSRREDVLDTVIKLEQPSNYAAEEGAVFEVKFEKARGTYGADAESFEAQMVIDDSGVMSWSDDKMRDTTLNRVVKMINSGRKQNYIAAELEISEARVSQLVKQARERGLLKEDNRRDNKRRRRAA